MLGRYPFSWELEAIARAARHDQIHKAVAEGAYERFCELQNAQLQNRVMDAAQYGNAMNDIGNDPNYHLRNAQGMLNSQAMATSPVQTTGQIDPKDISNGFYPHLRKVGPDDPEFLDIVQWLIDQGAPATWALAATLADGPGQGNRWMPANIVWTGTNGGSLKTDALMTFNFPHVALTDLQQVFHFGDPRILEFYPGPRTVPSFVQVNPVGVEWPENGSGAYRPSDADNEASFPYGALYSDATGTYRKQKRGFFLFPYAIWFLVSAPKSTLTKGK